MSGCPGRSRSASTGWLYKCMIGTIRAGTSDQYSLWLMPAASHAKMPSKCTPRAAYRSTNHSVGWRVIFVVCELSHGLECRLLCVTCWLCTLMWDGVCFVVCELSCVICCVGWCVIRCVSLGVCDLSCISLVVYHLLCFTCHVLMCSFSMCN